jgi:small subunit ribosomal protein S19
MARKFVFHGKSLEEVQALSTEEFLNLIKSRARRYVHRMPVDYKKLLDKVKKVGPNKEIKTTIREAVILPQWVGMKFKIHGGKEFKLVTIQLDMVGKRLGDFVHTTGRVLHSGPGVGATRGSKFLPLK